MCNLITSSDQIGSRWIKDYGKDACYPHYLIFVSTVLIAFPKIFSEGIGILAQLVRLKESPTSMELEPAMDYVCVAVFSMLCADDTCIVL